MPYCPKCGVENPASARFCDQCGTALIPVPTPTPVTRPQPVRPVQATQMPVAAGPITCSQCGARAIAGEAFCDTCGAPLNAPAPVVAPAQSPAYSPGLAPQPTYPPPQPAAQPAPVQPVYQPPQPAPMPPAPVAPVVPARTSLAPARLIFDDGRALSLPSQAEATVGRADPISNYTPEIDLAPHGALDNGVGRRHARLFLQQGQVLIEDLDSTNGTLLNGQRLTPRQPRPLQQNDVVQFGKLRLQFSE